ncbi:MAG: septal ring lytic transglycosylase RlpA family protein [Dethiobacteria bacterium]|jgi:uncharacterized protein YabE (DUF348 family)
MEGPKQRRFLETVQEGLINAFLLAFLALMIVTAHTAATEVTINDGGYLYRYRGRAVDVAALLKEKEITLRPNDTIDVDLDVPLVQGMEINIQRAIPVRIHTKDGVEQLWTTATHVAGALNVAGIEFKETDEVEPGLWTPLRPNQAIVLTEIDVEKEIEVEKLAFAEERQADASLIRGKTKVVQEGVEGLKQKVYRVVYANGKECKRELVAEEIIREPISKIVAVGTAPPPEFLLASRGGTKSEEQNAVRGVCNGTASWYGGSFHGCNTHYGEIFNKNEMTAASRTLGYNTKVKVTFLKTGRSVIVRINDYGPFNGHIIDLSEAAAQEIGLKPHGVGKVKLEVLE